MKNVAGGWNVSKCRILILAILACIAIGLLPACSGGKDNPDDWGSFTADRTYSYDEKYYASQSVKEINYDPHATPARPPIAGKKERMVISSQNKPRPWGMIRPSHQIGGTAHVCHYHR